MSDFEKWWRDEGSAMRPNPGEDAEEHAKRVAAIAWANGAYVAEHHRLRSGDTFNPTTNTTD